MARRLLPLLVAVGVAFPAAPSGAAPSGAAARGFVPGAEAQMVGLVNAYRAELGLAPLTWSSALLDKARAHTRTMLRRGAPGHSGNLRPWANTALPDWQFLGENVGMLPLSSTVADAISAMHQAFVRSPTHQRNLAHERFNLVAVGVLRDERSGLWVTEVFAQATSPPVVEPPAPPPPPVAAAAPPPPPAPPRPVEAKPRVRGVVVSNVAPATHVTLPAPPPPAPEPSGGGAGLTVLMSLGVLGLGVALSRFVGDA